MRLLFRVVIAIFVIIAGLLILKAVAEHFNLSGVKYFLNQLFMFADKIWVYPDFPNNLVHGKALVKQLNL